MKKLIFCMCIVLYHSSILDKLKKAVLFHDDLAFPKGKWREIPRSIFVV